MRLLRVYADFFEQVGIDEAYLDVTEKTQGSFETAADLAQKMKEEVRNKVGSTFSVGIGPNKLVAKIAADTKKPDGVTIVMPDDVEDFLAPLPVNRLLGVGRKTTVKMGELGIQTIGDLGKYNVQELRRFFGKKMGIYFHKAANGVDDEAVREASAAESVSRIATLKENTRDLMVVLEKSNQLIEEINRELVKRKLSFRQVGIIAIMTDLSVRSRSRTLEAPTSEVEVIKKIVRELFEKFLEESQSEVRRVGVKISQFARNEVEQKQLTSFFNSSP